MRRFLALAAITWPLLCGFTPGLPDAKPQTALEPDWLVEPSFSDLVKSYPKTALEKGVSGRSEIACDLQPDGRLADCTLTSETPADAGFGAASLSLADKFRMKPDAVKVHLAKASRISVPIRWAMITEPNWVMRPSGRDFASYYPEDALSRGAGGTAVMQCRVLVDGHLGDCVITSETPLGLGFGKATLRLAAHFRMRPEKIDGEPVSGAVVVIPINWSVDGAARTLGGEVGVVLTVYDPAKKESRGIKLSDCPTADDPKRKCGIHPVSWMESPSSADLAKIFDQYKPLTGTSEMICNADAKSTLYGCRVLGKVTPNQEAAMRALAALSKVAPVTADNVAAKDGEIILVFNWKTLEEERRLARSNG